MNNNISEADEEQLEIQSQLNRLPDEILLHIFNKLLDLKCLCWCSLVSKRFTSLIPQVHSVSFTVPRRKPNSSTDIRHENPNPDHSENLSKKLFRFLINDVVAKPFRFLRQIVASKPVPSSISSFYGDSFRSAVCFLSKFKEIRSLHIELPSSCHQLDAYGGSAVIKWRVKFGIKLETFAFLSASSIRESQCTCDGRGEVEVGEGSVLMSDILKYRVHLAFQCLKDAIVRHRMLLFLVEQHPMLRSVRITDSKKQGMLSVADGKFVELRDWISSGSGTLGPQLKSIEVPVTARQWHVPMLVLPVSGYVMEGVMLVMMGMVDRGESRGESSSGGCGDDGAMIGGAFEEGEEAFREAVMEMVLNHGSKMKRLL